MRSCRAGSALVGGRAGRPGVAATVLVGLLMTAACGTTVPGAGVAQSGELTSTYGGGTAGSADGLGSPNGAPGESGLVPSESGDAGPTAAGPSTIGPAQAGAPGSGVATGPAGGQQVRPSTGGSAAGPAASGRGWTAQEVYIGVTTVKDLETASSGAGIEAIETGDNEAQANAVAAYLNARGGLFGRKVVIVIDDHSTAEISANREVAAQESCTTFTQDTPVVAVINTQTALETPSYLACLAKAGIPLFGVSVSVMDKRLLDDSKGLYFPVIVPPWDRFAGFFTSRLKALGYFSPWNTDAGGPGQAPVRVAAYIRDDPMSERVYQLAAKAFAAAGHPPVTVFRYKTAQDASSAVLQFRSQGVTHVFSLDHLFFTFAHQAESQRYRPRYALHSSNAIGVLMQSNAPRAQNVGALGVGTAPSMDIVGDTGDITPGGKLCRDILGSRGQAPKDGGLPQTYAYSLCDSLRAAVEGFAAGGGLDGGSMKAGIGVVGPKFAPAVTFESALSATSPVFAGAARDIGYRTSCTCYSYLSPPRRF